MRANETDLGFMKASMSIEIPYFQRGYVWDEENWEELLDNLLDDKRSHFLGSIILKALEAESGSVPRWSVIDGQQRLTTLSILIKACYDALPMERFDEEWRKNIDADKESILFFKGRKINTPKEIKIKHSLIDAPDYRKVIEGKVDVDKVVLDSEKKKGQKASGNILQCYKFFYERMKENSDDCIKLWEDLLDEQKKMLVKIDLDSHENEQAIFDTVNSAGVRLTCADTIKNALFQRANENARNDDERHEVLKLYQDCWEGIFADNADSIEYWSEQRQLGRMARDNLEVLLHCVALIKGFYRPETDKISDLSQVYKSYISGFEKKEIRDFICEIKEYAVLYRKFFYTFRKETMFRYDNDVQRLFHVLNVCEVSTLHPYILKLFKDYRIEDESHLPKGFKEELYKIEVFVIRHIVCKSSTKNFNKVCAALISGKTSIQREYEEKRRELSDEVVRQSLQNVKENKIATLALFWIELTRRGTDNKHDGQELKYVYSLEHVMPRKWEQYWGTDVCPVYDVSDGHLITDAEMAKEVRYAAVYEIGNMALLNSNLNSYLRNYEMERKVYGENRKKGIQYYADLTVAREVVKTYEESKVWNEASISQRTERLSEEFIRIWKEL